MFVRYRMIAARISSSEWGRRLSKQDGRRRGNISPSSRVRFGGHAAPSLALLLSLAAATTITTAAATSPATLNAGLSLQSVSSLGTGRYRVQGVALDSLGNPACALVLANGKCMFSCGPGSLRCEGGSASLPLGSFDLTDLPLDSSGAITVQVFVQGHVSHTETTTPISATQTSWGVWNNVCCPSGPARFSVTLENITRTSELASCASDAKPTWEGYAPVDAAPRQALVTLSSACGTSTYPLNVSLNPGTCYLFANSAQGGTFVQVLETNCQPPN